MGLACVAINHIMLFSRRLTRCQANRGRQVKDIDNLRRDVLAMVNELHANMQEISTEGIPQADVVNNARDRLHYISALTEQAAGRTLAAAEAILDRLKMQQAEAARLHAKSRSTEVRDFLARLQEEHQGAREQAAEIIQAQEFQDLVGQLVNKLLVMVEKMEANLAHLLLDAETEPALSGPQTRAEDRVSQDDIDSLFD